MLVAVLCTTKLDFGPMAKAEIAAAEGDLGAVDTASEPEEVKTKGRVFDLIIPVIGLIVFSVLAMLYTGGFFEGGMTLADGFGNCDSAFSLVLGGAGGLIVAFLLFVPRGVVKFRDFMAGINEGIKSMVPAFIILTLAWTISGVCSDEYLNTGNFVGELVRASNLPMELLPAIVFAVAGGLAFATGTSWGTFGILVPIVLGITASMGGVSNTLQSILISAVLAGAVYGDHISPISDTTILSSTGAGCNHILLPHLVSGELADKFLC